MKKKLYLCHKEEDIEMKVDNNRILKVVNEKNKHSWQILFDHYYPSLCSYVDRFIKDREAAQDVVQEVFIGLWKSKQQFTDVKNLTYYLYKSCYHRSLNQIRNQKSLDSKIELIEDKEGFDSEEVYEDTLKEEIVRLLYHHINNLPAQQKEVIMLRLKGYAWTEIAEELDISINTIKTYRQRAFKSLSTQMDVSKLFVAILLFSIEMFSNHQ